MSFRGLLRESVDMNSCLKGFQEYGVRAPFFGVAKGDPIAPGNALEPIENATFPADASEIAYEWYVAQIHYLLGTS